MANKAETETNFIKDIDDLISGIGHLNLSDEDYLNLNNALLTFLKFTDLKGYLIDALFQESKKLSKFNDYSFLKISKVIIRLGDTELLHALQTYLISQKLVERFLILLQQMVKQRADTTNAERLFMSVISIDQVSILLIEKYLQILSKDNIDFVKDLLKEKYYYGLQYYLKTMRVREEKQLQHHIIPTILQNFDGDISFYLALAMDIIGVDDRHAEQLINTNNPIIKNCQKELFEAVIDHRLNEFKVVKNYSTYLYRTSTELLADFEDCYCQKMPTYSLLYYGTSIYFSDKRKILSRLLELKNIDGDNRYVMDFIKNFPQYKQLLPML
jgi:hypothetical protein